MEIRIKIPEELKSYIVDDWAQICRRKRLAILPARFSFNQIGVIVTFHIQDDCRSADQRVHADENNEQGREAEEQQREGNTGGGNSVNKFSKKSSQLLMLFR